MAHICHITTVHPAKDVRIFHKECQSLAAAGHQVTLLVGNGESEHVRGVEIIGLPFQWNNRLQRFLRGPRALAEKAMSLDADIYHFHDPEFLTVVSRFTSIKAPIIYDIHEDLPRQILGKHYLPSWLARLLAKLLEHYENRKVRTLDAIITATEHIRERFKDMNSCSISIHNYPVLDGGIEYSSYAAKDDAACYIGSLTRVRETVEMVKAMENRSFRLHLAGNFSPQGLQTEVEGMEGWKQVDFHGFVNRDEAHSILSRSKVGLVTLHPLVNYLDALPVKMFEYMAAGIPVITSDIPLWKHIVEGASCGVAVDPLDPKAIGAAIQNLLDKPEESAQMGARGRKAVESKYNWESESRRLSEFYDSLLNKEPIG